jgi:hypothetical protein
MTAFVWLAFALASPPGDDAIASVADARPAADIPALPRSISVRAGEVGRITTTDATDEALRTVEWVGADGDIVTVEYDGWIVGLQEGVTEVRPVVSGQVGRSVRIEVEPSPVVAMLLDGAPTRLIPGEAVSVRAMAYRRDLTFDDVTHRAVWSTSDPGVIDIDDDGRIVAIGKGAARVDAWIDGQVARSGSIYVF